MIQVIRGGKDDYTCEKCGRTIPAKTPHWRTSTNPFKRYHDSCIPSEVEEAAAEETPEEQGNSQRRDAQGRYVTAEE